MTRVAGSRHRHELDAAARRRPRRHRARRQARDRSSAARRSHASVRASTRDRTLHPDAIARTVDVLRKYRDVIDELGVEQGPRATATSTSRDAHEPRRLLRARRAGARRAARSCSRGEEEARLEFLGATAGLGRARPYLVVDVGGGSTEFIVGRPTSPRGCARSTSGASGSPSSSCTRDPPDARGAEPGRLGRPRPPRRRRPRWFPARARPRTR